MVSEPLSLPEAFTLDTPEAHQCQAAFLLLLGVLTHREPHVDPGFTVTFKPLPWDQLGLEEDCRALGIPDRIIALRKRSIRRRRFPTLANELRKQGIEVPEWFGRSPGSWDGVEALSGELAYRMFESPSVSAAAKLIALSVHHPEPLVRVAAASACFGVMSDALAAAGPVLLEGTGARDPLVRDIAATALARVAPEHPGIAELTGQTNGKGEGKPSNTSLLVHGTWARTNDWWQPGGDFHTYLLNEVDSTLYAGSDRFEWSGGWSDQARAIGAIDLLDWIVQKGWSSPDLFTHSHGGSIAMLANHALDIGKLVLLSCPVHRNKYWPDFNRVQRVVSIRVHLDLVILADFGGQRFRGSGIEENVLPIWFDHFATHDPDVWDRHDVKDLI